MELENLLERRWKEALAHDAYEQEVGKGVFAEWRDRYIAALGAYIRTLRECEERGIAVRPYRSRDWCNAAIHVLVIGDLWQQSYFLRADPSEKDKIVEAVLSDGGVTRPDGFFSELPPS